MTRLGYGVNHVGGPFNPTVRNFKNIQELINLFGQNYTLPDCYIFSIDSEYDYTNVEFACATVEALTKLVSTIEEFQNDA